MDNSKIENTKPTSESAQVNVSSLERLVSASLGGLILVRSTGRSLIGAGLGGFLAYRGLTGHCRLYQALGVSSTDNAQASKEVSLCRVITVGATPQELYHFFREQTEKMAQLTTPVLGVERLAQDRYQFTVKGPLGEYSFISHITQDQPEEYFAWESEEGDVTHRGCLTFTRVPRGTEVKVSINYLPPLGRLARNLARLTGMAPNETLERALKQIKAYFETGEVPTVEGQPCGAGQGRTKREGATA